MLALALMTILAANPPTGDRLITVINAPLTSDPVRKNTALTTTVVAGIDVENTRKSADNTQLFVITNMSAANRVCVGTVSAVGQTCDNTRCGTALAWTSQGYAGIMDCTTGSANMGSVIPAAMARSFRYDGTRCLCVVASAASTDVQVERTVR